MGLELRPNIKWDGTKNQLLEIEGYADSNYAQCPETRRSVSGNTTTLNGAPVITNCKMQPTVKLSVTEAELDSAITEAQDMLFVKEIIESMEMKVKLPMILWTDNKGVYDIANNWTTGGRTRHIATRCSFLRELRENGLIKVEHEPGEKMRSDMFTKNLDGQKYEQHRENYMSKQEEMEIKTQD